MKAAAGGAGTEPDFDDLVMGVVPSHETTRHRLSRYRNIYFCDLRNADLSELELAEKSFYGCILSAADFSGSRLDGCEMLNCFVAERDGLPRIAGASCSGVILNNCNFKIDEGRIRIHDGHWKAETREAVAAALDGNVEALRQALASDLSVKRLGAEGADLTAMLALLATFLLHPDGEYRLSALFGLSEILGERPEWFGEYADAYVAFMMYRSGDESDGVYYDAVRLVERLQPTAAAVAHVFRRIASEEPAERREGIRGVSLLLGSYDYESSLPFDALLALLADPDSSVVEWALQVLRDLLQLRDGYRDEPGLTPALVPLLQHPVLDVRLATLSTLRSLRRWPERRRIYECLDDEDAQVRREAFMTLFWILPSEEVRQFLERHKPPDRQCYEAIIDFQRSLRGRPHAEVLIEDDELEALLESGDGRRRLPD